MIDLTDRAVFLCGPMTGIEMYNLSQFARAHRLANRRGARHVYDPAYEWLTEHVDGKDERSHSDYLRRTVNQLTKELSRGVPMYDFLVRLEGWAASDGARREVEVADACGIPVIDVRELL
jgi:hypothetical protein